MSKNQARQSNERSITITFPENVAWHMIILQAHAAAHSLQSGCTISPQVFAGMILSDWVHDQVGEEAAFDCETWDAWEARPQRKRPA